jgi:hypothetical protein
MKQRLGLIFLMLFLVTLALVCQSHAQNQAVYGEKDATVRKLEAKHATFNEWVWFAKAFIIQPKDWDLSWPYITVPSLYDRGVWTVAQKYSDSWGLISGASTFTLHNTFNADDGESGWGQVGYRAQNNAERDTNNTAFFTLSLPGNTIGGDWQVRLRQMSVNDGDLRYEFVHGYDGTAWAWIDTNRTFHLSDSLAAQSIIIKDNGASSEADGLRMYRFGTDPKPIFFSFAGRGTLGSPTTLLSGDQVFNWTQHGNLTGERVLGFTFWRAQEVDADTADMVWLLGIMNSLGGYDSLRFYQGELTINGVAVGTGAGGGDVYGSGTEHYIPKWDSDTSLTDSHITDGALGDQVKVTNDDGSYSTLSVNKQSGGGAQQVAEFISASATGKGISISLAANPGGQALLTNGWIEFSEDPIEGGLIWVDQSGNDTAKIWMADDGVVHLWSNTTGDAFYVEGDIFLDYLDSIKWGSSDHFITAEASTMYLKDSDTGVRTLSQLAATGNAGTIQYKSGTSFAGSDMFTISTGSEYVKLMGEFRAVNAVLKDSSADGYRQTVLELGNFVSPNQHLPQFSATTADTGNQALRWNAERWTGTFEWWRNGSSPTNAMMMQLYGSQGNYSKLSLTDWEANTQLEMFGGYDGDTSGVRIGGVMGMRRKEGASDLELWDGVTGAKTLAELATGGAADGRGVTGDGTTNYFAEFSGDSTLVDGPYNDDGTTVQSTNRDFELWESNTGAIIRWVNDNTADTAMIWMDENNLKFYDASSGGWVTLATLAAAGSGNATSLRGDNIDTTGLGALDALSKPVVLVRDYSDNTWYVKEAVPSSSIAFGSAWSGKDSNVVMDQIYDILTEPRVICAREWRDTSGIAVSTVYAMMQAERAYTITKVRAVGASGIDLDIDPGITASMTTALSDILASPEQVSSSTTGDSFTADGDTSVAAGEFICMEFTETATKRWIFVEVIGYPTP